MIKCIIVDDEPLALSQLQGYISRISFLQCVGAFPSANDATAFLAEEKVDAMFVDINMPDVSGLQLVKNLVNPPKVVFTTAYSEYAIDGFRADAVGYLLKPFGFDELLHEAYKLLEICPMSGKVNDDIPMEAESDDALFVKSDYRVVRVSVKSIKYIESMSEYVRIFVDGEPKPIVSLLSMKKMEETLAGKGFMRVHRSYIVNLNKIKEVSRMRIVYDGGVFIPIGDMYKDAFFEYIDNRFIGKK